MSTNVLKSGAVRLSNIKITSENCIGCGECVSECLFLQEYGSPDKIAEECLASALNYDEAAINSYNCSACSLCDSVCPVDAQPSKMFEMLRNHAQENSLLGLDSYSPLLSYERIGGKFPFKDNLLPDGCKTAFFPGCTLPALFPEATRAAYSALKQRDPSLGLILNCCSKPSKMLGLSDFHAETISELSKFIESQGITKILTACPNCHITFKGFSPSFKIVSIYEELLDSNISLNKPWLQKATVHDPCVTRFESGLQESVRKLLTQNGVTLIEMDHSRDKTICCGEGGGVGFHNKPFAQEWNNKRKAEAAQTGAPMVTYCAGCTNYLSDTEPVAHILDLLFVKRKETPILPRFPFNYFNRLKLRISARFA
ncbi:MAG: (Fe-S)-binding protein [Maridesulfovibrio ferrireducens]|nr:(Fe-S)-binding protein [Maridesulfovibrio ferrireducens]